EPIEPVLFDGCHRLTLILACPKLFILPFPALLSTALVEDGKRFVEGRLQVACFAFQTTPQGRDQIMLELVVSHAAWGQDGDSVVNGENQFAGTASERCDRLIGAKRFQTFAALRTSKQACKIIVDHEVRWPPSWSGNVRQPCPTNKAGCRLLCSDPPCPH